MRAVRPQSFVGELPPRQREAVPPPVWTCVEREVLRNGQILGAVMNIGLP